MLKANDSTPQPSSNKIVLNIEVNSGGECANVVELFSAGLVSI